MPLWTTDDTTLDSRPKYLHAGNIGYQNDPDRCFATMHGWMYDHPNSEDELLVAISGLSNTLAAATIASLQWGSADATFYPGETQTVVVVYNEEILNVGTDLTLSITNSGGSVINAAFVSQVKNKLTFTFTVPSLVTTLSITAGTVIILNTSTLNDADGNLENSAVTVNATVAAAMWPSATKAVAIDAIVSAVFSAGTYHGGEATHTLTVNYASAVTVAAGTPTILLTDTVAGAITASYSTGTGTTALVFTFTVPDNGASSVITLGTQTIGGTGTMKDASLYLVDRLITVAVGSTTGAKTITADAIASVAFSAGTYYGTQTSHTLTVTYATAVTVTGSPIIATRWTPVIGGVEVAGPVATYDSGTGTTALVFNLAAIFDAAGTLKIVTQNIGAGGGTMVDAFLATVNHNITSGVASTTGTKVVALDTISTMVFGGDAFGAGTGTLTVNYATAVTVAGGVPTIQVTDSVAGLVTASYASGTGTTALVFDFTVPNNGIASTLAMTTQTILGTGTMVESHGATVDHVISNAVAIATTPENIVVDIISTAVIGGDAFGAGAGIVTLTYNHAVKIDGANPTLVVTDSVAGAVTATYNSGTGTTALVFNFTVPDGGVNHTLTVGTAQTLANNASIKDNVNSAKANSSLVGLTIIPEVITVDSISSAVIGGAAYGGGTGTVTLNYTSDVKKNGANPTLVVTDSVAGAVTATYASGTGTTALVFNFTVPNGDVDHSLDVGTAQVIANAASIQDNVNSSIANSSLVGLTITQEVIHPIAPVLVVWDTTTPFVQATPEYLIVHYSAAVTVAVSNPTVIVTWTGLTNPQTATYASGTGTTQLRFDWTIPAEGGTASIAAQSIVLAGGSTMKDANGGNVNLYIPAAALTYTGTKVIAP
jgi:hypothetical protein